MAKRSANKWYKIIGKSMQPVVGYDPDMRIITAGGAIGVRAEQSACGELLVQMGLMDFGGNLKESNAKGDLDKLFAPKKVECWLSPYYIEIGEHLAQLVANGTLNTVAAYRYDYTKLITRWDSAYMTDEEWPKLIVHLADNDDEWDLTDIVIAPITLADWPELARLKKLLPNWKIV